MIPIVTRRNYDDRRPPSKEDTKKGVEDHQIEVIIEIEDILEEEDPLIEVEDPCNNGGPLMNGGPPGNG